MSPPGEDDPRPFVARRRVYLGDVSMRGRLRLDAMARYLQDIAADDAARAALPGDHGWVVRRMAMTVQARPELYEEVELATWCSGAGSRWAERTTTLAGASGEIAVEARAVWVFVQRSTGAPAPLPPLFFERYGDAARRKVSARLVHPAPPEGAARRRWQLRDSDFDVLGHVNNAAYWEPTEEALRRELPGARIRRAEIEFRAGIDPGDAPEVATAVDGDGLGAWFVVAGEVRASVRVGCDGPHQP